MAVLECPRNSNFLSLSRFPVKIATTYILLNSCQLPEILTLQAVGAGVDNRGATTLSFGRCLSSRRTRSCPSSKTSSSVPAFDEVLLYPAVDSFYRIIVAMNPHCEAISATEVIWGDDFSNHPDVDHTMEGDDVEGRDEFIELLESRFLFLAADARSTLRSGGWRPSYRDVLLGVRRKLGVPCSSRLSTEDLEIEIFLHLLNEYASPEGIGISSNQGRLEVGLSKWKVDFLGAVKLARRLSGSMLVEAANYQIRNEVIKRGGQFAAVNLESRVGLLAARQERSDAAWTAAVGDVPGRCGDPNAWYRLCENSPRNLCLCADPPHEGSWLDICQQQPLKLLKQKPFVLGDASKLREVAGES
ncbi:unnamed protein product [Spirodela intermedia]|uniref:Uncharacterized protein n=1 Tax=Spirodela intermedia TaxID=51605 RepID=A0A7I8J3P8_SPIIN|nr:unnamed protein product [Spirodela intermedia]CAA6664729.1 unnamed protein product [Spirodela intermedia]